MSQTPPENEFSLEVDLTLLPPSGKMYRITVRPEDYVAVAKRLGVAALNSCSGEIELTLKKPTLMAKGLVRAALIRECVASLEEMVEIIDDRFEIEFLRHGAAPDDPENCEEENLPEIHHGDIFDVGELLIQQVSLAMATYPRKDGALSLAAEYGVEPEVSPFAVLQQTFGKSEENH